MLVCWCGVCECMHYVYVQVRSGAEFICVCGTSLWISRLHVLFWGATWHVVCIDVPTRVWVYVHLCMVYVSSLAVQR